jgi:hypothetical protein
MENDRDAIIDFQSPVGGNAIQRGNAPWVLVILLSFFMAATAGAQLFRNGDGLAPDNLEIRYWVAIEAANGGEIKKAASLLKRVYARKPAWKELTRRVHQAGILKVGAADLKTLMK